MAIIEETEEKLSQAIHLINCLINNPDERIKRVASEFVKENSEIHATPESYIEPPQINF